MAMLVLKETRPAFRTVHAVGSARGRYDPRMRTAWLVSGSFCLPERGRCTVFKQDSDRDQVIDQRRMCLLGAFKSSRLAFASARLLISALIFSIKVLVSAL
jgi:hypothetical protein